MVGCGALGSMLAERLVRSGVGMLRLVDRDWVELSNLQRQTLFTERDARERAPKRLLRQRCLRRSIARSRSSPMWKMSRLTTSKGWPPAVS
ncbi:MAG: ThiF family adenylyltransferase [Pirellulaceae bacterium]